MAQTNSRFGTSRPVRREEFFAAEEVAALQAELVRLRSERDSLAAERDAARTQELVPRREMWRSLEALADRLFALPSHTTVSFGQGIHRECAELVPIAPRHQWLQSHFLASWRTHRRAYNSDEWCPEATIEVLCIAEVYNDVVATAYRQEVARIREVRLDDCTPVPELDAAVLVRTALGGPRLNEALLYHGCALETARNILNEGFDSRLGGANAGQAFGCGSYFTTVASKADFYTDIAHDIAFENQHEVRVILVARVALGEVCELSQYDRSLRRPPVGDDGLRHDAVLGVPRCRGGCVDHDEFVIYRSAQAVPQHFIACRHLPDCRCRTCIHPRR